VRKGLRALIWEAAIYAWLNTQKKLLGSNFCDRFPSPKKVFEIQRDKIFHCSFNTFFTNGQEMNKKSLATQERTKEMYRNIDSTTQVSLFF
jgi:hypothetical protein